MSRDKILPFNYLKGSDFTQNLKKVTNSKDFLELSQILDVPKSTFSTWNSHERTSHELMVRLSLALDIPLSELALAPQDRHLSSGELEEQNEKKTNNACKTISSNEAANSQHQIKIIPSACLTNGKLIDTGEIPYPARIMGGWNINTQATIEIETNEGRFLVDKSQNDAVSGDYLIDMNGRMSINHIQRLPNKLAIVFGNSTVEVSESDIEVVGKVVVEMRKG